MSCLSYFYTDILHVEKYECHLLLKSFIDYAYINRLSAVYIYFLIRTNDYSLQSFADFAHTVADNTGAQARI